MRIAILDWNGKARLLAERLRAAKVQVTEWPDPTADAVLIDIDHESTGRIKIIDEATAAGAQVWLYPHGAGAYLPAIYDGLYLHDARVTGSFVHGPGQIEVAKRSRCPHKVVEVGFTLAEVKPRTQGWDGSETLKVLFAPIHPPYAWAEHPKINRMLFDELVKGWPSAVEISVRSIRSPEENNLDLIGEVSYFTSSNFGDFGEQLRIIDAHDVVVAADSGTFAGLAAARGKALVVYDSERVGGDHGRKSYNDRPTHWGAYRDYIAHPFDYAKAGMWKLIERSARDVKKNAAWAAKFIGSDLDASKITTAIREVAEHGRNTAA